jgi:hypothetical protein
VKKRWIVLPLFIVFIIILLCLGLFTYIAPSKQLTMDYTPIKLENKILDMARNLNTELVLTETEINALIKKNMDPQLNKRLLIEGAHFTLEDNILHANLNVLVNDSVPAELHASYRISWDAPDLRLQPIGFKLKDIKLPNSWLDEISFPIYEGEDAIIGIDSLYTKGNELVIKLKLNLFSS